MLRRTKVMCIRVLCSGLPLGNDSEGMDQRNDGNLASNEKPYDAKNTVQCSMIKLRKYYEIKFERRKTCEGKIVRPINRLLTEKR